jgi:hypothetical protein
MNESSPAPAEYQDRSIGLMIFGILTIVMGTLCALCVPLMLFSQSIAARDPMRGVGFVFAFYAGLAVLFVWLGIGSIMARRWARALLAIISWGWMAMGLVSLVSMVFMMPQMLKATPPPGGKMSPGTMEAIVIITVAFTGGLFVVIPGIWAFFYSGKNVKATCEHRDPVVRWTDRCPLPVLGAAIWVALCAACMLMLPLAGMAVLPMFGSLLSGPAAIVVCLVVAGVLFWTAWAIYRLQIAGWWVAVVFPILFAISSVITYSHHSLEEVYRLAGYTQEQIALIQKAGMPEWFTTWGGVVWTLPVVGYLLFIRRYFRKA